MTEFVSFLEKTWFLWWIAAIICILRWFHAVESEAAEKESEPRMPESTRSRLQVQG
jgi:hypothetical protein